MKANSILIFIFMSLTVLNLNSCKYRANFTETLAAQDTKSTLISQEYFEIGPLNGREATPEELSSFAKQIRTYDLVNNKNYSHLKIPISPLAIGLAVYQPLKDLTPLQMIPVVKAQLIKIEEKNGTTEKTFKISDSLYFKSTLPTYLHIDDSGINKHDAQKQKIDELLPKAKCYLNFILFTTPGNCQDISLFFKSNFKNPGIFLVETSTPLGVRAVKGLLRQYDEDQKFVFIRDPNTELEYKTKSIKIEAFYEEKVTEVLEKKPSRSHDSQWLQGDEDFMVGYYLIGHPYVYHNSNKHAFTPEEVDVLGFKNNQVHICIKSNKVTKFVNPDTIYIHRKNTTLGKRQEIFDNFLTQCKNTEETECYVKKHLVSLLKNSSVKDIKTNEFTEFPMPTFITSVKGLWLIDVGLGYKIIEGSTARGGNMICINTTSGTVYNLHNRQILAYFVDQSSTGEWLRGRTDFNVGNHLRGRQDVYHNSTKAVFKPNAVNFISIKGSQAIILVHGEKNPKIVNGTALYIQRKNTTLGREQEILDDFLTQCKSNKATDCYLKKDIQLSLKNNGENLNIKHFTSLPTIETNSAPTTRFWLVDMGLGYEIITGNAKRTPKYLEILTPTDIPYKLTEEKLIGYFLK